MNAIDQIRGRLSDFQKELVVLISDIEDSQNNFQKRFDKLKEDAIMLYDKIDEALDK